LLKRLFAVDRNTLAIHIEGAFTYEPRENSARLLCQA
jgi:hypothetical protein